MLTGLQLRNIRKYYIKAKRKSIGMRKNSEQNICPIEIDPVTDEYKLRIPEWLLNDMGWYEGTELQWIQDSDIICIEEVE